MDASVKPVFSSGGAILWGGLTAGVLDAIDDVVAFGTQGLTPNQVRQYIASGCLGQRAFAGGLGTAGLDAPAASCRQSSSGLFLTDPYMAPGSISS